MLVIVAGITGIGAFPQASAELSGEIQIGAIAPLSGDWSTNGIQNNVANKVAVDDFNAYLEAKGASWSLMLVTEDSQTVPTVSLEKIQAFNAKNIKHVIGPQTSGSLQNIKGYVDSNNMLIISCCSTSPLLAIPDDSVFRLVPDDSNQAIAISKLLDETGIEVVVPVWRNDAWGMGLHDALANSFSGTVSDGISYNPEGSEFSVEASLLAEIVQEHIDTHGADKVGVVYIGFAEAIPFFQSSAAHDVLNNVRWFGSDGSAKESGFINDPDALQFSTNTEFTAVVVASGQNELSQRVETAVEAEIGVIPTAYASASYDAIWLLGLSMERTESTDVDVLTEIIPEIANEHMGALGSLTLNSVGDLAQANYEMWTVADNAWQYAGVYDATADSIEFAAMDEMMDAMEEKLSGEIQIGAIVPITGKLANSGEENKIGYELAVVDFNKYLEEKGAGWSLSITSEDSQTSPTVSLEKVQALRAQGIQHVIGPQSSGNIQNIKGYVDSNNILIISPSSTSPLLAIPDDSIFRLAPDDSNQAVAIAKLLEDAGISVLVPVWREDAWGVGLDTAIRDAFPARGGIVDDGIGYSPEISDFSTEASLLAEIVRGHVDENDAEKVAVVFFGFGEAKLFFQSASTHDILNDVRWFGADGTAKRDFIEDPIALGFSTDTDFTAVVVASGKNDLSKHVEDTVMTELGRIPSTYASSAYDAIWLLGLSMERTQSTDVTELTAAFPEVAAEHQGALGSTELNENGDLAQTNYDVWTISDAQWTQAGVYYAATDSIELAAMVGDAMEEKLSGEIQIGAIAPLSGDWSTNGIQNNVANKVAVDDFNAYLEEKGASWSLMLVTEDSQTVPTVSLEKIQAFNAKNIKHVIGPQTSGSLQNIKGYVDSNNMLIISCCSTSPLLAIPDDSVFRLVPDDSNQAIAISKLLDETGIEVVVPVWRNDAWGMGLHDALANSFSGTVSDGISYNPEGSEFSVEASLLADIVQEHIDKNDAGKVGVVYIGFAEAIPFFQSSAAHDVLNNVRWFGSDGSAKESGFINDPDALQFSTNTKFTAVVVASGQNELSQRVETAVEAEIGVTPTAYASASYDAIWLLGLSMERTQSTDVDVLTEIIPEIANEHMGALGSLTLNSVGDLAQANYEMWTVADNAWQYAGVYDATADSIEFAAIAPPETEVTEVVPETEVTDDGGCLIATAAYGSELAPQVQFLREIRDSTLLSTASGASFMTGFNQVYYSFSPAIADLERENPIFRDMVRAAITPAMYTMNIMTLADPGSEASVLVFGMLSIGAIAGIYVAGPYLTVRTVSRKVRQSRRN